jgi:transcriptional regulator with XRE-family HTH domain
MDAPSLDVVALGRAIVKRREGLGWTTYRLADRAGISDPYLRRLESGNGGRVGIETVSKIARALAVTMDDILRDVGLPTPDILPAQVAIVYEGLGDVERRAWIKVGRTLGELRTDYEALQSTETHDDIRDRAAWDRPDAEDEMRRQADPTDE